MIIIPQITIFLSIIIVVILVMDGITVIKEIIVILHLILQTTMEKEMTHPKVLNIICSIRDKAGVILIIILLVNTTTILATAITRIIKENIVINTAMVGLAIIETLSIRTKIRTILYPLYSVLELLTALALV